MSSLKQNQNLLQENNILKIQYGNLTKEYIQEKKKQNELNFQIYKLMKNLNDKMDFLLNSIDGLKNKSFNSVGIMDDKSSNQKPKKEIDQSLFIPTLDTSNMKGKFSTIDKKNRKTNIKNAANKLSNLEKEGK